ncbi:TetR/AcrR family transcriptional regulator [Tsukamurella sp. 8F]|uniref:TetR/AcrR family transcriptional regulator n=1 Tax=unclassified Tsukamurella TaxID=2633480 RepID=UPI0023B8DFB7|nr:MULTISPECIES: TetR/AcrR family transcriptional regulator [unclassified Tsukamurella]MDF0528457.1 TetR/AcrR family transcriptional regulator [Tsukamurella sp. 8J]MDF0586283.1 TetR/AcrR family transcriptional regulator [Tsukamurella sp. 8F]
MNEVKPRRRDISKALTRAAMLDAARTLFATKGFDATSIDDIARASESSNGAVYHHFRDKQQIFADVFRDSQAAILQASVADMPTDTTAWERVEFATRAFLRGYVSDTEARALLGQAIGVLGWDRVHRIDEEMSLPLIRAGLAEAVTTGEATSVPVDAAADLLISVYCSAILIIAARPDPDQAAAEVETVLFALLSGLRTKPH